MRKKPHLILKCLSHLHAFMMHPSLTHCPVSGWMDSSCSISTLLKISPGRWKFSLEPAQDKHAAFRTPWLHSRVNGKSSVLVFMEPLFHGRGVPVSTATLYFEAPGRQAQYLPDSLFSVFLENRKQMAWGPAEWNWILIGRGYRTSKDWAGWVCFRCLVGRTWLLPCCGLGPISGQGRRQILW